MASEPPVAVYDACVLYPFHLRNLLIQCAVDGLVKARWSDDIHAEWIRNLAADMPGLSIKRLEATRELMKAVLPEATVTGYQSLLDGLDLPDPNDRHVLATAIVAGASTIVTWNLKDFPKRALRPHGMVSLSPDQFLTDLYTAFPEALLASLENARHNLRKTNPSPRSFLDLLDKQGLKGFANKVRPQSLR